MKLLILEDSLMALQLYRLLCEELRILHQLHPWGKSLESLCSLQLVQALHTLNLLQALHLMKLWLHLRHALHLLHPLNVLHTLDLIRRQDEAVMNELTLHEAISHIMYAI